MTLTYELGLGIPKMYPHTKNEDSRSRLSKVRARTGHTHRDRHTHILTDASKSITIRFVGGNKGYRKQSKQDFLGHEWLTLTFDPMTFQR